MKKLADLIYEDNLVRRADRFNCVRKLKENPIIINLPDQPVNGLVEAVKASILKGVHVFTLTHTNAHSIEKYLSLINELENSSQPVLIGVSNVSDVNTVSLYIDARVAFIVGSNFDELTAKRCNRSGILYIPFCRESSEVSAAADFGVVTILCALNVINPIVKIVSKIKRENPEFSIVALINGDEFAAINAYLDENLGLIDGIMVDFLSHTDDLIKTMDERFSGSFTQGNDQLNLIGFNHFSGIEHIGLYQTADVTAREIAEWYAQTFGFELQELEDCVLLESFGAGRIEVVKQEAQFGVHIAVQVKDMEAAIQYLSNKGIETESTVSLPNISWTYLKQSDPLGNHVHLVWRRAN